MPSPKGRPGCPLWGRTAQLGLRGVRLAGGRSYAGPIPSGVGASPSGVRCGGREFGIAARSHDWRQRRYCYRRVQSADGPAGNAMAMEMAADGCARAVPATDGASLFRSHPGGARAGLAGGASGARPRGPLRRCSPRVWRPELIRGRRHPVASWDRYYVASWLRCRTREAHRRIFARGEGWSHGGVGRPSPAGEARDPRFDRTRAKMNRLRSRVDVPRETLGELFAQRSERHGFARESRGRGGREPWSRGTRLAEVSRSDRSHRPFPLRISSVARTTSNVSGAGRPPLWFHVKHD